MTIMTKHQRLNADTQGEHIELRTVYTGSKEEIDMIEEKLRVMYGDMQILDVPDTIALMSLGSETVVMEDSIWQARN